MRIAAEHDVDLSQVEGTGRGGRVSKKDVLAYVEGGAKEPPPMHIESPYRPDEPAAKRRPKPRLQRVEEVEPHPGRPAALARRQGRVLVHQQGRVAVGDGDEPVLRFRVLEAEAEHRGARLPGAQRLAGAAEAEVGVGDGEAVFRVAED